LSYYIRTMTKEDLPEVTEIDREAFPTQWPAADYAYEFKNRMAHYVVACDSGTTVEPPERKDTLGSWLSRMLGRKAPQSDGPKATQHYIVGFAGFWVMAGEAHVTSIAVREKYRRRGIGEMLLVAVTELAIGLNADIVTLEVRASNFPAQNLYTKYGFNRVGERKAYYLDRGPSGDSREDAIIMTTDNIHAKGFQERLQKLKEAVTARSASG